MSIPRRVARALSVALASLGVSTAHAQADSLWNERIRQARALIARGNVAEAEALYLGAIDSLAATDSVRLAAAHFGRAAAIQIRAGNTDASTALDTSIAEYSRAISLDPSLRSRVEYNLGLISRTRGEHREALGHFARAQRGRIGTALSQVKMEIAREYEALDDTVSTSRFYREALEADSLSRDALREYFRVLVASRPAEDVIKAAQRWGADSSRALIILTALPDIFTRESRPPDEGESSLLLRSFARFLTTARVGPPWFADNLQERLERVIALRPPVRDGVRDILAAYAAPGGAVLRVSATPTWWGRSMDDRATWSSLLRWIGDWYYSQDRLAEARSYYEAAIGNWRSDPGDPTVDRKAVLPLALIYAQTGDESGTKRVQDNINVIFNAKAMAYQRNSDEDIRDFHTALGAYYATKGKWTGDGAQNAEFQLSRMREATQRLASQGKRLQDPPDLLASLAQHYQYSEHPERAESIKTDLRRTYQLQGKAYRADSVIKRIEQPTPILRTTHARPDLERRLPTQRTNSSAPPTDSGASKSNRAILQRPQVTISVRPVDGGTGRPIAAKEVLLLRDGARDTARVTLENGVASLSVSATESVQLQVAASGYVTTDLLTVKPGQTTVVRMNPRPTKPPLNIRARPPQTR
jgi:tetratricopeptide (TPR) repeat protein